METKLQLAIKEQGDLIRSLKGENASKEQVINECSCEVIYIVVNSLDDAICGVWLSSS